MDDVFKRIKNFTSDRKRGLMIEALAKCVDVYVEFNLSKNKIEGLNLREIDGQTQSLFTSSKVKLNDSYDDILSHISNFIKNDNLNIKEFLNRERIIEEYHKGQSFFECSYYIKYYDEDNVYVDHYMYVYEDDINHDIKAISYIIDKPNIQEDVLLQEANIDYLTKCVNRRILENSVNEYINNSKDGAVFMFIDIDNMKMINDYCGHLIGDKNLVYIADIIRNILNEDDVLARVGGDEFCIFIPNAYDRNYIAKIAQEIIKKAVLKNNYGNNKAIISSISIGIAIYPDDGETFTDLYRNADKALYHSKEHGRARFTFFDDVYEKDNYNNVIISDEKYLFQEVNENDCRNILDSLNSTAIYVIDEEYRLLFYNRHVKDVTPHIELGMKCSDIWNCSKTNCPIKIINQNMTSRTIEKNNPFGDVVEMSATRIMWRHNIPAYIVRIQPYYNYDLKKEKKIVKKNKIGTYIIDEKHNIKSYSDNVKNLYPQLKVNKKCYECLFNKEEPCINCPIYNPNSEIEINSVILEDNTRGYSITLYGSTKDKTFINEDIDIEDDKYRDAITGSYNRNGFIKAINDLILNNINLVDYSIIYVNINNFKAVNAVFGSEAGDNLLRIVYMRIYTSGIKPKVAARVESDRFCFLVYNEDINFDTLVKTLEFEWKYNNQSTIIHCRAGIYDITADDKDVVSMIDKAKLAKRYIKDEFVKPYAIYNQIMHKEYVNQAAILSLYEQAIENKEFKVYYQPVIDANTLKIVSAEALVRWVNDAKAIIQPDVFIPLLEQRGYISKLDLYVIRRVHEFISDLINQNRKYVPISVNISRMDFYDDAIINEIKEHIEKPKIPNSAIKYEITESSIINIESKQLEYIQYLRERGKQILIDDFGSGFSSLGFIQNFEFDILKLDISLIRNINLSPNSKAVVKAIVEMCKAMNVKTVAEGVENKREYELLKELGCDYIQGYYFSKALSKEEFDKYLKDNL